MIANTPRREKHVGDGVSYYNRGPAAWGAGDVGTLPTARKCEESRQKKGRPFVTSKSVELEVYLRYVTRIFHQQILRMHAKDGV